ncbi:MAG: indole-3-glycerol phosphate synthase TrpC [Victivallaceae bacterium]
MNILEQIIDHNRTALAERKKVLPLEKIREQKENFRHGKDFAAALRKPGLNIIAELKKASPSKGLIRENFDYENICVDYERNGAAALSVLTEQFYFQGSPDYLKTISGLVNIPLLRKDFIFDSYQIEEAVYLGADAILLIAAALDKPAFTELYRTAEENRLDVLSEVHTMDELEMALDCGANIIGVNCRNLKTFATDLELMGRMLQAMPPEKIRVAESGLRNHDDLLKFASQGANAFLIGETFMRAEKPGDELKKILGRAGGAE